MSTHKSENAYAEIRKCEADVLFLPAYSPDLNPIEKMWSKVKQVLRGIKARTEDELFTATGTALSSVTAAMPRAGLSLAIIQRLKVEML